MQCEALEASGHLRTWPVKLALPRGQDRHRQLFLSVIGTSSIVLFVVMWFSKTQSYTIVFE